jgi:phosphopantothenoylcysteine decarboxylase/phosphopantothenate--cysteine ligase
LLKGKKILIGVTGGIAAYKVCHLVRLFVKNGAEVRVIMTPSATKFISPLALSVLSQNEVIINMFPPESDINEVEKVESKTWHVSYGIWADVFIIAPTTGNSIAKIVTGISDNFLLCTVLASRAPIIIVPTMDDEMYKNEITQENIRKLKRRGYYIIEPTEGELASGLHGIGKMAEPDDIFEFAKDVVNLKKDLLGKRILVTAGPTYEPIDSIRFITNYSSGKMGFEIAKAASERGAKVTLITGPVNLEVNKEVRRVDVETSEEMLNAVKKNMKNKDLIIMAAAVEDFRPTNSSTKKIKKEEKKARFNIEFEKSPDILKFLGDSKSGSTLIGFALETDNEIINAKRKLVEKSLDMIVLNNANVKGAGFRADTNVVTLIDNSGIKKLPKMTKFEVGNAILDYYVKKNN